MQRGGEIIADTPGWQHNQKVTDENAKRKRSSPPFLDTKRRRLLLSILCFGCRKIYSLPSLTTQKTVFHRLLNNESIASTVSAPNDWARRCGWFRRNSLSSKIHIAYHCTIRGISEAGKLGTVPTRTPQEGRTSDEEKTAFSVSASGGLSERSRGWKGSVRHLSPEGH